MCFANLLTLLISIGSSRDLWNSNSCEISSRRFPLSWVRCGVRGGPAGRTLVSPSGYPRRGLGDRKTVTVFSLFLWGSRCSQMFMLSPSSCLPFPTPARPVSSESAPEKISWTEILPPPNNVKSLKQIPCSMLCLLYLLYRIWHQRWF